MTMQSIPLDGEWISAGMRKDNRLQDIELFQERASGEIVCVKRVGTGRVESRKWAERLSLNCPYLLDLLHHSPGVLIFRYPEIDLQQEIDQRRRIGQLFTHQELMLLTYQVLMGLHNLHSNLDSIDDLQPKYIECLPGTFYSINKLIDRMDTNDSVIDVVRRQIKSGQPLYCSPRLYYCAKTGELNIGDTRRNDLFSVGMCVLEAGLLASIQSVYMKDQELIDKGRLLELISQFDQRYRASNNLLCQILALCLSVDEASRPTSSGLLQMIPSFKDIENSYKEDKIEKMRMEYIEIMKRNKVFDGPDKQRNVRIVDHVTLNEMAGLCIATHQSVFGQTYVDQEMEDFKNKNKRIVEAQTSNMHSPASSDRGGVGFKGGFGEMAQRSGQGGFASNHNPSMSGSPLARKLELGPNPFYGNQQQQHNFMYD